VNFLSSKKDTANKQAKNQLGSEKKEETSS
jgi:hypothetical protein